MKPVLDIHWIASRPTCVDKIPPGCSGVSESVLRSYQTLRLVKQLLECGTPHVVILALIEEIEDPRRTPQALSECISGAAS